MPRDGHRRILRELVEGSRTPRLEDVETLEFLILEAAGTQALEGFDAVDVARVVNTTFRSLRADPAHAPIYEALAQRWGRLAWHVMLHGESTAAICVAAECAEDDPGPIWPYRGMGPEQIASFVYARAADKAETFDELLAVLRDHLLAPCSTIGVFWSTAGEAARTAIAMARDEDDLDALEDIVSGRNFDESVLTRDMIANKRVSLRVLAGESIDGTAGPVLPV